jgi:broad specificity phosphatase PhoE
MKLHFLRHAESLFNATGTSEKDCELSEKGKQQATEIKEHYDLVICSTMKRACSTLDHSQLTYGRLIFTDLCREKRVDICDFLPYEDETNLETDAQLEQRIRSFLYFVKSQVSPHNNVLVISHRDFIHAIGKGQQPPPNNAEIQIHDV